MSKKNSLLWKISGEGLKAPCYLFGTMHVQDERAFRNIEFIEQCIADCDAFAAEYDLDVEDPSAFEAAIQLPKGQLLSELLSKPVYEKLSKVFKRETGLRLKDFDRKKPVIIANLLSVAQFGEERAVSLDQHLFNTAKDLNKSLLGIESFEAQLHIMKKMSLKGQLKTLQEMATNFGRYRRNLKKTAELYIEGDLNKILKKVKENAGGMRRLLLYDRNIVMAERIAQLGAYQSIFVAVGAGHLGGKKGVLHLLKEEGFKVEAVIY